jgi:hypothetical protein
MRKVKSLLPHIILSYISPCKLADSTISAMVGHRKNPFALFASINIYKFTLFLISPLCTTRYVLFLIGWRFVWIYFDISALEEGKGESCIVKLEI